MSWSNQDNPNYRGPIDRQYVSRTESWEIRYFVDNYLEKSGFEMSDKNREIVKNTIDAYPGSAPIKRDDLTDFLNKKFKK